MPSAADIALKLRLRRSGRIWLGACPSCGYKGAFSAGECDGRVLLHCHAGCPQDAVLAALRSAGLWHVPEATYIPSVRRCTSGHLAASAESSEITAALWRSSLPGAGTPVARYLMARGLSGPIPAALRYKSRCVHVPTRTSHPAMIAAVHGPDGRVRAVHRTYLRDDGSGKAQVEPAKMTLGPVRGCAVRLGECGRHLAVAEGIETALSVQQAAAVPAWAALSAGGIRSLILPPLPLAAIVTIAADPDPVGIAAAHAAAERWDAEGRSVRIMALPPGFDFNDLLRHAS